MSPDNVEVLRRMNAAVDRQDPALLEALLDPEVVWEISRTMALDLSGSYHGVAAVQKWFADFGQAYGEWDWQYKELESVGEHVVARMWFRARGRLSGIEMEADIWQVWTFRDGKVTHYRDFDTGEEAFEAARSTGGA